MSLKYSIKYLANSFTNISSFRLYFLSISTLFYQILLLKILYQSNKLQMNTLSK